MIRKNNFKIIRQFKIFFSFVRTRLIEVVILNWCQVCLFIRQKYKSLHKVNYVWFSSVMLKDLIIYSMQSCVVDSLFRRKYFIDAVVCMMIDAYNYLITPMRTWGYWFICYLIAEVISFCQLNYCFLMVSEICKEYRKY